jgi:hypothetical protein
MRVLLDNQDCDAFVAYARQGTENVLYEYGRETEAWLVEKKKARPRHKRPHHREHLLFAAGERSGFLAPALPERREDQREAFHVVGDGAPVAACVRAHLEIFADAEIREKPPALRAMDDAHPRDAVRLEPVDSFALKDDPAARRPDEAGDGFEHRGFAGAVGRRADSQR